MTGPTLAGLPKAAAATSTVLIGRTRELDVIAEAAGQVRRGAGRVVFVAGEPGIGKTRMLREAAALGAGMTVLTGRATPTGASTPFRPLVEAFNTRLRSGPPPADPALEPFRPALARLFPEWRTAHSGPTSESTLVVAEGLLRLLAALSRERPVALLLDDLHDADPETLDACGYLVANIAALPVLVLAAARTGPSPAERLAHRLHRDHQVPVLKLHALTRSQVAELTAQCLGTRPDRLPDTLADQLARDSDGVPFVVEELVAGMVATGVLRHDGHAWHTDRDLAGRVPVTVVHTVEDRADRLGPDGRRLLEAAAVFGSRFPLPVVRAMLDCTPDEAHQLIQAAAEAHLVRPDPAGDGWHAFRHALTADALRTRLTPDDRRALAGAAARALEAAHPDLPGELGPLAAELRLAAGDEVGAADLFATAGRRALAEGAAASAATLLERAHQLLRDRRDKRDAATAAAVLETLLVALEETGEFDRARRLVDAMLAHPDLPTDQAIALQSRLGWNAFHGGRTADAESRIAAVRMLLGPDAAPEQLAAADVVDAHVLSLHAGRADEAEQVALRAVAAAERVPLPEVVCRARQLLALLARRHGFAAADRHLLAILRMADEQDLPLWRVRAAIRLASNEMIRSGRSEALRQARDAAWAMGAVHTGYDADASLAMHEVFFGRYAEAVRLTTECATALTRFGKVVDLQYALVVRAAAHAHRGARAEMTATLAEYDRLGGAGSFYTPLVHGLCRAFSALLEEDRTGARAELEAARAFEDQHTTIYYQWGRYGLLLLLDALAGTAPRTTTHPAYALRWNRQFVHFAKAVRHGAAGDPEGATRALARAREAASVFPTAHRLGLRLVAESALEHGWGDPAAWLREAEHHFRELDAPLVASACRTLIRRAGQRAPQRRAGHDRLPAALREHGVTVREYEVLLLLADRRPNKEIAERLYLSHRTVEKHVASLLRKTGQPDRSALCGYADALPRAE
ncbi:AAA family ATPase [Asanoa sp. WMMD1127]|uniref:helix-turn-helix transcriptional regulator n=1 Tax=Asanoa sp. WMMD1127 TaxID=3016107 RepID=UPI0024178CA1|nr:AAA family ATPase [Asanoa sp. WMMD1127]MDG4826298.1 AAA family ATPase [Asanoa sp. WMMD1127]